MKPSTSSNVFFPWSRLGAGAAAVSLALAVAGCSALMPSTTYLDRTLSDKASFDLQCPKQQLQYVNLGNDVVAPYGCWGEPCVKFDNKFYRLDRPVATQQGVTGCERRASYTFVDGTWTGNGAAGTPPAGH